MIDSLLQGERINLSNYLKDLKQVKVEIIYELEDSYSISGSEINFSAFCLTEDKKFINELFLVNKKNNKTPDGALTFYKTINQDNLFSFFFDFTKINSEIKKVIFVLSMENGDLIYNNGFDFLKFLEIRLSSIYGQPFLKFRVPVDFTIEKTIEIFEIYHKDFQWKAVANSYGYIGSLGLLTEKYGLKLKDEIFSDKQTVKKISKKEKSIANEPLDKKLKIYREKLLDLSKRNPLISIKPKSMIKIHLPEMNRVFRSLAEDNETLKISPLPEDLDLIQEPEKELIADKTKKELAALLYRVKHRAVSSIEEQGVNILFLAFGFLTWSEKEESDDKFVSPIILVPVELSKDSLYSPYKIKALEDDIIINPALNTKLGIQFAVQLPDLPEDLNVLTLNEYFIEVIKRVKNIPGCFLEEISALGIFSFNKLVLYKDLETYNDLIREHPIINGKGISVSAIANLSEYKAEHLDDKISSLETFQVVDADSSQQEAIILAKKGVSFVLQGPPGTGKSQTITNIIAECISDGKSVLFVSEKMAALEVVKKRLENCGLGDFCIELHSHKTSKKEVIASLEKGLLLEQKAIKENVKEELNRLDSLKIQLNSYIRTLHEPRGTLEISTYKAQSQLVKLNSTELLIFDIPNLLSIDQISWGKINENLKKLAGLDTVFPHIENNPWRTINHQELTIEKETLIQKNIDQIIVYSRKLINDINEYSNKTGLKKLNNLNEAEKWLIVADFILLSREPVLQWLKPDFNIEKLKDYTNSIKADFQKYQEDKSEILAKYCPDFLNQNLIEVLSVEYKKLNESFEKDLPGILISQEHEISEIFADFKNSSAEINKNLDLITIKTGIKKPATYLEIAYLFKLLDYLGNDLQPQEKWFDENYLRQLFLMVDDVKNKAENFLARLMKFSALYNKEIISLDIPKLLKRFETEYNGFFRSFNPVYKADLKQLADLVNNPDLNYMGALVLLKKAEVLYKEKQYFTENNNKLLNIFGSYFKGENTDWKLVRHHLEITNSLIKWFSNRKVPDGLKTILIEGGIELQKIKNYYRQLKDNYSVIENSFNILIEKGLKIENITSKSISEIAVAINLKNILLDNLKSFQRRVKPFLNNEDFNWNLLKDEFARSQEIINFEKNYRKLELGNVYSQHYNDFETNWDHIIGILNWTIECRNRIKTENWHELFGDLEKILTAISAKNDLINILVNEKKAILANFKNLKSLVDDFQALFVNTLRIDDVNLHSVEFHSLENWFIELKDNFRSLREWFGFQEIEKYFKEIGIPGFIEIIIAKQYSGELIIDSFNKRFYQLWLDSVYKSEPLLGNFDGNAHRKLIHDFAGIDLKSIEIAKARLQVQLRGRIPQQDKFEMQTSEYGILNTEITKKRKHKPLRKLFGEIKNMLFTIKPCFMMSPLSVCQYIDPYKIKFDLVVFDEASQIFPEDAVSAVLRANQAIIVGDKKQMPPSNFFKFLETDENDEFQEDDVPEYESILEEFSNMGLPTRMLQWHYRSKDENLIAFSNKHFYENRLWTFPNKSTEIPAIEFIKVEGIYDRGSTRQNRTEAAKIAGLVFDHFKKHPSLSLGVITFSETQQMAILNELEKKRMEDQTFEALFESNASDKFFVKSIEHVQGDERDVIFFSICYGKDQNNKFSYSFGPLNQAGGERRLNVAVTRAKQHIKIVSSISYTDIDPARLKARGAILLRNYLEYAERGREAIFGNLNISENISFDSPFEKHVYEQLIQLGFTVRTQVGSSGYRVDLAIVDPDFPGRILLGVECDGAAYHSSKTARDRDRLRQQIMEGLGWRIHRIWSRDWITHQDNEINKIKQAVEAAKNFREKPGDLNYKFSATTDILLSDAIKEEVPAEDSLKKYQAVNIGELGEPDQFHMDSFTHLISNAIFKIVSQESPVHLSSVTKRIISAWKMTKAGAKIQTRIRNIIAQMDDHIRSDEEGFLWDIGMDVPSVRVPGDSRNIDEISKEEIAQAALFCLSKSFSAQREELIKVVAKLFGYNRVSVSIKHKIGQAIDFYLQTNVFTEEDNLIKLVEK